MQKSDNTRSVFTRKLPAEPDIVQVKRQAKELYKAFKDGKKEAVDEVQDHYHDAVADSFQLSESQLVLARSYGFKSWPKLKAYIDGVTIRLFCEAAKAGECSALRSMLKRRPELVHQALATDNEHSALHYAVLNGHPEVVRLLMDAGADARQGVYPFRDALTPLGFAKARRNEAIINIIHEVEQQRREESSCPLVAVSSAQDRVNDLIKRSEASAVIDLLKIHPDLMRSCDREGCSPLHRAAEHARPKIALWMIDNGAPYSLTDREGFSPLEYALHFSRQRGSDQSIQIAKALRDKGIKPSLRSLIALGDLEAIKIQFQDEPSVFKESFGWQQGGFLSAAVLYQRHEILEWLLQEVKLDPDEQIRIQVENGEEDQWSIGAPLWNAAHNGDKVAAKLLLVEGADPNGCVYASGTPMDRAYEHDDDAMKQLLIHYGGRPGNWTICHHNEIEMARERLVDDPDCNDAQNFLWSAASAGNLSILEMWLPALGWEKDDDRWFEIVSETIRGVCGREDRKDEYLAVTEYLLDEGISANVVGRYGVNLLHHTIGRGPGRISQPTRIEFLQLFLNRGADPTHRDDDLKSTPLAWACRWGYRQVVEYFLTQGMKATEPDAETWATPLAWAETMNHSDIAELIQSMKEE